MPKHLNNSRGLTLIELLGAIALTAIIITVAIALFASVSSFTFSNSEGRGSQKNSKYALSQISARLHHSDAIFQPTDGNELRYSTFVNGKRVYKAICYITKPGDTIGELIAYDFLDTSNPNAAETEWNKSEVSLSSTPDYYHNGLKIASGIIGPPNYTEKTIGATTSVKQVDISISFRSTRKTATGGSIVGSNQTLRTSVKLYNDGLKE